MVAVGVVKFGGPVDAGGALGNGVILPLITTSEGQLDLVFAGHAASGREIEAFDLAWTVHELILREARGGVNRLCGIGMGAVYNDRVGGAVVQFDCGKHAHEYVGMAPAAEVKD